MMLGTEIGVDHVLVPADRIRRALGKDAAVAEHDDLWRDLEHDVHVVLDEHDGDPLALPEFADLVDHGVANVTAPAPINASVERRLMPAFRVLFIFPPCRVGFPNSLCRRSLRLHALRISEQRG